jgi:hypothetical protein
MARPSHRYQTLSRGRIAKRGQRNRTEARYEELLRADPNVEQVWFEFVTLRISHPQTGKVATYTPDFLVLMTDGTTFIDEVKGSGIDNEASVVRLKAAAELAPLWRFRLAKERRGGGFEVREV